MRPRRRRGFVRAHPWGSCGLFGFVRAHPGSRRVHVGSLGSFRRAHVIVEFFPLRPGFRRVHSWFNRASSCGRRVYLGSLGSFRRAVGVVGRHRVCWVHSGELWGSSGSLGFVGFIRERPGGHRVLSGSLGSFGGAQVVAGFI